MAEKQLRKTVAPRVKKASAEKVSESKQKSPEVKADANK